MYLINNNPCIQYIMRYINHYMNHNQMLNYTPILLDVGWLITIYFVVSHKTNMFPICIVVKIPGQLDGFIPISVLYRHVCCLIAIYIYVNTNK